MAYNRGVLNAEHSLGWIFSKGISRGGLGEFHHDRLIAELLQGIDLIKQMSLGIAQAALRSSAEIQQASDELFEEVGDRIWLGRGHAMKPAWVANAGPQICGGLYPKDLSFKDPSDNGRLKSLFHNMIISKCRAFRQNRKQKDRPRQSVISGADSIYDDSGVDQPEMEVDATNASWRGAEPDTHEIEPEPGHEGMLRAFPYRSTDARQSNVLTGTLEPLQPDSLSNRPTISSDSDLRKHCLTTEVNHDYGIARPSLVEQSSHAPYERVADRLTTNVANSHRRVDDHPWWAAPLSISDEQKLSNLVAHGVDRDGTWTRDSILNLLRRINIEVRLAAREVNINLARCVSRGALFSMIDEEIQRNMVETGVWSEQEMAARGQVSELSFSADPEHDLPELLQRMVMRRSGFRDQFPAFLQSIYDLDDGLDTYNLSALVRFRRL